MQEYTLHISTKSLFKVTLFVLSLYILFLIWDTIVLLFVALIFSAIIEPFANILQKRNIPRGLSAIVIYIVLFGIIGLSIAVLYPLVSRDLPLLVENVSKYAADIKQHEIFQGAFGNTVFQTGNLLMPSTSGGNVFSSISAVFGGIFSFFIILVITFYLVVQNDPLRKILQSIVPDNHLPFTLNVLFKIREKLSAWIRGQLILSVMIGLLVFIALTLLNVRYAAVIALLAALLEFIPYIGPTMAALPALFFAFVDGGVVKMGITLLIFIIIQQFENHVLIPKVMQRAVGLNPVVSIVALILGLRLGGALGALLSIPVATALQVVVQEVVQQQKNKKQFTVQSQ